MRLSSNHESRRQWRAEGRRIRAPCSACGAPARAHSGEVPFCNACLDWARQDELVEWDELGVGD
jgi:hypothetical protein